MMNIFFACHTHKTHGATKTIWIQKEIKLKPHSRGFHLITREVLSQTPELNNTSIGVMSIFIKYTSASLTINENADPTVREDFENFFSRAVPENEPYYKHMDEGSDVRVI